MLSDADTLYSVFKRHTLMDLTYFFSAAPMKDPTGLLIASNIVGICSDSPTSNQVPQGRRLMGLFEQSPATCDVFIRNLKAPVTSRQLIHVG